MISMPASERKRPGFTLVELLVVISIIILMITLTLGAIVKFRDVGPRVATKSNLKSIKAKLDAQWKAVLDKARTDTIPTAVAATLAFPVSDPRGRAQYIQLKLEQAFPVSFSEVMTATPSAVGVWPSYSTYLNDIGVTPGNAATIAPIEVQQAICLLMALRSGPSNPGIDREEIGSTATQYLTVGPNKVYGCTDAWNKPVLFTRGGDALTPVILSAGPDGKYGVDLTTQAVTSATDAADNLTTNDP